MKNILDYFFKEGKTVKEITMLTNKSKTYVYSVLKKDSSYNEEVECRKKIRETESKEREEKIKDLFFNEKLKPTDIAAKLGVLKSTVTSIIKKDCRYKKEKRNRKNESAKRNKEFTLSFMKEKRQSSKECTANDNSIMANLELLQKQNAISMSRSRKISDEGIVSYYLSCYDYDGKKKKLVYNAKRCGTKPSDMPNSRNIHTSVAKFTNKPYSESIV